MEEKIGKERLRKKTELNESQIERARTDFCQLLIKNANYFGNLPQSKLKPELLIKKEIAFEDISCVGFNPDQDMLYAIIRIKRETGYGGSLCSSGSYEYVRFYVDWNGNGNFTDEGEDLGVASVNVHDIPGNKPLTYCVQLKINPLKHPCFSPQKVQVRAILAWNAIPPSNTPDYTPVFGEVEDRWIQIKPSPFYLSDFVDKLKIKIEPELLKDINISKEIGEPPFLTTSELKVLYKGMDVPEHRIEVKQVSLLKKQLQKNANITLFNPAGIPSLISEELQAGLESALKAPLDVKYEELRCVGLQYDQDALAAVFTVKLSCGFSGGLCTQGSQEYVAFWADWDNTGTFDELLGITTVNVHDIPDIPAGGLQYAVNLPIDLASKRRSCTDPKVVRIRAILSWEVQPSPTDPDFDPIWGNRIDTLIQIKPGVTIPPGVQIPYISAVGNMAVMDIDTNGYANGTSILSGFTALDSPFGGTVTICGHISNAPNLSAGAAPLKYYVAYRKVGEPSWINIANKFQITITESTGSIWHQYHVDQMIDAEGYYTYQEDLAINPPTDLTMLFVEGFVMGKWNTRGLEDGLYEVKICLKTPTGDVDSNIVKVYLDNTPPHADITITEFEVGGVSNPATPCGRFPVGAKIKGKFTATDAHFFYFTNAVEPASFHPNAVVPYHETYPALPAPGALNKDWVLDTTDMEPCGYVVYVHVWDRTIVDSGYIGWYNCKTVGFCLL